MRKFRHGTFARVLAGTLAILFFSNQIALADQTIGDAQVVVNDVRGTIGQNAPTVLRAGIDVFQNEIIRTGDRSASRVLFQDNTTLSIGASSEVKLDRFVFDPDPSKSQVALSIARGVVRFATGGLPKSAYQISTPTATIGVRGTIGTISVAADGTTTINLEEGSMVVVAGGVTVVIEAGMTCVIPPGGPPGVPYPTPSTPPSDVSEMDYLLADNTLKPGGPAGNEHAGGFAKPLYFIGGGLVIGGIVLLLTGNGNGHSGGSSTSTTP